jgi:hypothetical protein
MQAVANLARRLISQSFALSRWKTTWNLETPEPTCYFWAFRLIANVTVPLVDWEDTHWIGHCGTKCHERFSKRCRRSAVPQQCRV